jgi:glycosyltransferase involved in cell wall biosynthesis
MGIEVLNKARVINSDNSESSPVRLLMIGTIEPRKNYSQVLEWLQSTKLKVHLDIVGRQGWKSEDVSKTLLSLQDTKDKTISWHKNLSDSDLEDLYSLADIGVCASNIEGFGIPLRDFLARNLNVVASDIPPFRELQENNKVQYSCKHLYN